MNKLIYLCILASAVFTLASCDAVNTQALMSEALADLNAADIAMGDYQGEITYQDKAKDGAIEMFAAQVISLGDNKYKANILTEFDKRAATIATLDGVKANDGTILFVGSSDEKVFGPAKWYGTIKDGLFSGNFSANDSGKFAMTRSPRLSPTLGQPALKNAKVLFDGTSLDNWKKAKTKDSPAQWKLINGAMEVVKGKGSIITKENFGDFKLHLEFRSPFMPKARGQGRGNSGLYLQGKYEVQILDSYGLEGRDNECGGIYRVAPPKVNMCAPPTQWQTYDVAFIQARFDKAGKKTENARITVYHNGVKIHDDIELPRTTGAAMTNNEKQPGGIYLQDHGNAVQYRNIWLVEVP